MQTSEAFVVAHSPVVTAGRVARNQNLLRRSLVSLLLWLVITVVYWWFMRDQWSWTRMGGPVLVGFLIGGGFLAWRLVALRRSRSDLGRITRGEAFRVDHSGVTLGASGELVPWGAIRELRADGRSGGAGPVLVLDHTGGRYEVPLSFLDALPGTIDSALRAYSGGRRGLNLSNLDSVGAF